MNIKIICECFELKLTHKNKFILLVFIILDDMQYVYFIDEKQDHRINSKKTINK